MDPCLGIFSLGSLVWDFGIGILGLGLLVWNSWFGFFGLGVFSFGIFGLDLFCLESSDWGLWVGIFDLRSEAGGTSWPRWGNRRAR